MLRITVNGKAQEIAAPATIASLLQHLGVPADRVAVEMNRVIVRKPAWDSTPIPDGAEFEIVHFVGGGAGKPQNPMCTPSRNDSL